MRFGMVTVPMVPPRSSAQEGLPPGQERQKMKTVSKREAAVAARKKREHGATFLEYALLLALVGIVGAVGVMKYGKAISDFFSAMANKTAEVTPKTK